MLDSAEGLIARLQYLGIPMTATEQAVLAAKYGSDIQRAVTTRFDRLERTLSDMEDFLAFHRPLFRVDFYVELNQAVSALSDAAFACSISGLRELNESIRFISVYSSQGSDIAARVGSWFPGTILGEMTDEAQYHDVADHAPATNPAPAMRLASSAFLSLRRIGNLARLIDIVAIATQAICTDDLFDSVSRVMVDVNGYELFNCPRGDGDEMSVPVIPHELGFAAATKKWRRLVRFKERMILAQPLRRSPRFVRPS